MKDEDSEEAFQAFEDLVDRWTHARIRLDATDAPQWKRTHEAMMYFKGLKLTPLPRRWRGRVEKAFAQVNQVLAKYPIETWDDMQKVSAEDLSRIDQLITAII